MTRGYERTLGWALRHPRTMLVVTLATVALNVALFVIVPRGSSRSRTRAGSPGTIIAAQGHLLPGDARQARGGGRHHPRAIRRSTT